MGDFKVLVPLDGSRLAEHALAFLPSLSRLGNLEVTLLSVVDFTEEVMRILPQEETQREHNLLATYQREVRADLETHLQATVKTEVMWGGAADFILDQVERDAPDLLIISTHGRSGLARWSRGSVADKVLRDAVCPVLAVGPKAMEHGQWMGDGAVPPFAQVLVPLDGSEPSEEALPVAARWAECFGSHLHLLRVMPFAPLATTFVTPVDTIESEIKLAGQDYLDSVADGLSISGEVIRSVRIGTPARAIDTYIAENQVDLVVMTSHARRGIVRAALGSVTDRIIGSGPPVLVIRPGQV
jgi:nucleotide-binding universal stress UspA family protein